MMSEEDVLTLARDIVARRVFTSNHIRPEDLAGCLTVIFLPLAFMNPQDAPADVGMLWEFLDRAGPRYINGYPSFGSLHYVTQADTARVNAAITMLQATTGILSATPPKGS